MRKLRQAGEGEVRRVESAIAKLKEARDDLKRAGARKAARYVSRCLKSAEGARRHAERCALEPYLEERRAQEDADRGGLFDLWSGRFLPDDDDDAELACRECRQPMQIDGDGVSAHLTEDGKVDYDQDADHVAYATEA